MFTTIHLHEFQDYEAAMTTYNSLLEKDPMKKVGLLSGIGRLYLQVSTLYLYWTASRHYKKSKTYDELVALI